MFTLKKKLLSKLIKSIFILFLILLINLNPTNNLFAITHEWIGVPITNYGEQFWDKKSIKRNQDGSIRVLSKFIPETKSEITQDIIYTMDINCFKKSFKDVEVTTDELNVVNKNNVEWKYPNGDKLILAIINQVCNYDKS